MKAAITGPTGHVGITLARTLLNRGHSVRALIRGTGASLDFLPVERVHGDIGSPSALAAAFAGIDVVFHTAARISITRRDAQATADVNVGGTRNVIEACRRAGVRRLVHFSSIEALDPFPLTSSVDEDRPWVDGRAGSPYALSKALAEAEVKRATSEGMDAVILNPTAIIGPHDLKPSLLGRAIMAFARGSLPFLVDGGFDWVDVRDVVDSAVQAAERGTPGSRYILGGRWASLAELAALACEATGARPPRITCPFPLAQAWAPLSAAFCAVTGRQPLFTGYSLRVLRGNRNVTHDRAAADLGHTPRDLRDTVRDTCAWFREQGWLG
jgi:dihydroflavonol-4-reductase